MREPLPPDHGQAIQFILACLAGELGWIASVIPPTDADDGRETIADIDGPPPASLTERVGGLAELAEHLAFAVGALIDDHNARMVLHARRPIARARSHRLIGGDHA